MSASERRRRGTPTLALALLSLATHVVLLQAWLALGPPGGLSPPDAASPAPRIVWGRLSVAPSADAGARRDMAAPSPAAALDGPAAPPDALVREPEIGGLAAGGAEPRALVEVLASLPPLHLPDVPGPRPDPPPAQVPATNPGPGTAAPPPLAVDRRGETEAEAEAEAPATVAVVAAQPEQDNPPPHYPSAARRRGWQGLVVVRVQVGADGLPQQVELAAGSGHGLLDQAALDAVRNWRFRPARRGTTAISDWLDVPIRFTLRAAAPPDGQPKEG